MSTPFARRSYAGGASATLIPLPLGAAADTFDVADGSAYPTANFFCVVDLGTATEEKIFVGSRSADTFAIVARGEDGTVAKTHPAGATLHHIGAAQDFDENNVVASALSTKGDILVKGVTAGPARLPVGANGAMLVADSAAALGVSYLDLIPAGTVLSTIAAVAPAGYLLLDGSTIVGGQTTYPKLWLVIPAGWKSGANINLPDARGRTIAMAGTGPGLTNRVLGSTFGEENHVLTIGELATHGHGGGTGVENANHTHGGTTGGRSADHVHGLTNDGSPAWLGRTFLQVQPSASSGLYAASEPIDYTTTRGASADHNHGFTTGGISVNHAHAVNNEGSSAGHNNMPPALALNIMIRAV